LSKFVISVGVATFGNTTYQAGLFDFKYMALEIVPIELDDAKEFVRLHHRHHIPPLGHRFSIGCAKDNEIVGVAIIGRPVARLFDNGWCLEATRICTISVHNTVSKLTGAIRKTAKGLGYRRIITYTLNAELGTSLIASGWTLVGKAGGGTWNRPNRSRDDKHPTDLKNLYEIWVGEPMVERIKVKKQQQQEGLFI
jgi:hypothetical protein